MSRRDEFDDEDGFFDNILKNRGGGKKRHAGHPGSLRRVLMVTAGLAVLGVLGAVLWSTWPDSSSDETADASVPIIRADTEAYKVKPDEPGGMAVPNQDSTIFNTLKGEQATNQAKVENLYEDTETPVRKEEVFTASEAPEEPAATTPAPDAAKDVASKMPSFSDVKVNEYAAPEPTPAPADVTAVPPMDTRTSAAEGIEAEPVKPETPAAAPAKTEELSAKSADAIQPAAGGNFYVQLASVKSEADAKAQWPKFQAQYSALSDLPLRVQRADLAKGTYYRVQGGPITESDARKVCSSINGQKAGSCVVAKR